MGVQVPVITIHSTLQAEQVLRLRPNAQGSANGFIAQGAANKYDCVNDVNPDEDTTYIYSQNTGVCDCCEFHYPNHTTEGGTINKLKLVARARSLNAFNIGDYFYLTTNYDDVFVPPGLCSGSGTNNLPQEYTDIIRYMTVREDTSNPFTWTDIDNLQAGVGFIGSAIDIVAANHTYRPNAAGTYTQLSQYPASGSNYDKVDEEVADGFSTYVYPTADPPYYYNYRLDTYNIPNSYVDYDVHGINSVTIYYYIRTQYTIETTQKIKPAIRTHGSVFYGIEHSINPSWTLFSYTWTTNPSTSNPWTKAEIDALEIGIAMRQPYSQNVYCTQLYIIVNYNAEVSPEIRCTQYYVDVYYIDDLECQLPKPIDISTSHDHIVKALTFWSGNREVYGLCRESKRLLISGMLWDGCTDGVTEATDLIGCIKNVAKYKQQVSICGFRYGQFNTSYKILSFGWKKHSEQEPVYDWILELEFDEDDD